MLVDVACIMAEAAYAHAGPEHQQFIALYSAALASLDDRIGHLEGHCLTAARQFAIRLAKGTRQLDPALEELAELMKTVHDLWPQLGADAIIAGTLEAVAGMCVEQETLDMKVIPEAVNFLDYIRNKTGMCMVYAEFVFCKPTPRVRFQSLPQVLSYLNLVRYSSNGFDQQVLAGLNCRDQVSHVCSR